MNLMSQKGLAPILIVLIIAVLVGGYFIYQRQSKPILQPTQQAQSSQTPHPSPDIKSDETGHFKIYTNHLDNYTFKYPTDWQLSEIYSKLLSYTDPRFDNPDLIQVSITPPGQNSQIFGSSIVVKVNKPYPRADHSQELKKNQDEFDKLLNLPSSNGTGQRSYKVANTIISGEKAVQTIQRSLPGDATDSYCELNTSFIYGVYNYTISISCEDKQNKQYAEIYQQVLGTFKLLSSAPTPKTMTLKTFKADKLGYSFNYPENWLINTSDPRKGIIVVDEDDHEQLTLLPEKYYPGDCPQLSPPKEVEVGGKKVTLTFDCDFPRVKTSNNQEFRMMTNLSNPKVIEILKSMKGLTVMKKGDFSFQSLSELISLPFRYIYSVITDGIPHLLKSTTTY